MKYLQTGKSYIFREYQKKLLFGKVVVLLLFVPFRIASKVKLAKEIVQTINREWICELKRISQKEKDVLAVCGDKMQINLFLIQNETPEGFEMGRK